MSKEYLKIITIEFLFIIFSLFQLFVLKQAHMFYLILELLVIAIIFSKLIKVNIKKDRYDNDLLIIIVTSILFYYIITYFIGFFTGFIYSNYSKSLLGMSRNIIFTTFYILISEYIREKLVNKTRYYKSTLYIIPIIFTLLELSTIVNFNTIHTFRELLTLTVSFILPYLTKNILLTYITYRTGKRNSIIYQGLILLPNFVLPIFPNLGEYFSSIINVLLPLIIMATTLKFMYYTREKITSSRDIVKSNYLEKAISISLIIFIITTLYLSCGLFRYQALAIGSQSMTGTINKGDVVIIDTKKDINEIKVNDIIAFEHEGKVIVHRVSSIKGSKEKIALQTKGDANNADDSWVVINDNYKGKINIKIKMIGWPTVALSELLK